MPTISAPSSFNFLSTVYSHGWYQLAPYAYDEKLRLLSRIQQLSDGSVVQLNISDAMHASGYPVIYFSIDGLDVPTQDQEDDAREIISRLLSLDWDLEPFYAEMAQHPGYEWIVDARAGRMLVGATVWEDLAKTLLTTNTNWAQTRGMVERLCTLGEPYRRGDDEATMAVVGYAFPSPDRIAAMTPDEIDTHVRAGYRSAYLHQLADRIASGELDVESWYDNNKDDKALYEAILSLKGFGDYAAGTMMRLLGRFEHIAIDSECRATYKRLTGSDSAANREIIDYYRPFGPWRGLAMWMDIMKPYTVEGLED